MGLAQDGPKERGRGRGCAHLKLDAIVGSRAADNGREEEELVHQMRSPNTKRSHTRAPLRYCGALPHGQGHT